MKILEAPDLAHDVIEKAKIFRSQMKVNQERQKSYIDHNRRKMEYKLI